MAYADEVAADGPVLAWPLDEPSGVTATDVSGEGRHGTYHGGPGLADEDVAGFTAPLFGNGTYVQGPTFTLAPPFTLECWYVRRAHLVGYPGNINSLAGDLASAGNGVLLRWEAADGPLKAYLATGAGYVVLSAADADDLDVAHHVALTATAGGDLRLYLDGVEAAAAAQTVAGWNLGPRVARSEDGRYLAGGVAWLAVYDTALSAARIAAHYTAGTSGPEPLTVAPAAVQWALGAAVWPLRTSGPAQVAYTAGVAGFAEAGEPQSVALAPASRGPVVYGPDVTQPGTLTPRLRAALYRRPDLLTPVVVLDQARARRWQDTLTGPGAGSLELAADDPDLAAFELDGRDVVRIDDDGRAVMSVLVSSVRRRSIDPGEEGGQVATVAGPGLLAMLREAVVYPARGPGASPVEVDRGWSWSTVDYDDTGWAHAVELAGVTDVTPAWQAMAAAWPDAAARWLWAPGASVRLAPAGWCYFRQRFHLDEGTRLRLYAAGDDTVDVWLDGVHVITGEQWTNVPEDRRVATVDLDAGWHAVAAAVSSLGDPADIDGPFQPAGFVCSAHAVDAAGVEDPSPLLWTDDEWLIAAYPPGPPGMTPGEVLLRVIAEAQFRGALAGLATTFTAATDTAGRPWPRTCDIATKVGTDLLTFAGELAATYCDLWMSPVGVLSAWNRDGRGRESAAELAAGVNLTALEHLTVT